jgi:hypothetical protein
MKGQKAPAQDNRELFVKVGAKQAVSPPANDEH